MKHYREILARFLEGKAPNDLLQKVYQVAFEFKEAIAELLSLAVPEVEGLDLIIEEVLKENISISVFEEKENPQKPDKLLAEKRLDYLILAKSPKLDCDIYVCLLHQSSPHKLIELDMLEYIVRQYRRDANHKRPLRPALALILNTSVESAWKPKESFQEILNMPDNDLLRKSSVDFRIYSVNANDPKLKDLAKDKALMSLILLEQLRKKNLSEAEALRVVREALSLIKTIPESPYREVIELEILLTSTQYPENRQIIDQIIKTLSSEGGFAKQEVEEINMTYAEQKYNEGLQQGVQQGIQQGVQQGIQQGVQQGIQQGVKQGAKKLLLELIENQFGKREGIVAQVEAMEDYETLKEVMKGLHRSGSLEDFLKILERLNSPLSPKIH